MYVVYGNRVQIMLTERRLFGRAPFQAPGQIPWYTLVHTLGQVLGQILERSPGYSLRQILEKCGAGGLAIFSKVIDYQGGSVIFGVDCIWFTSTYESQSKSFAAQIPQELLHSLDAKGFSSNKALLRESKSGSRCRRVKHQIFLKKPLGDRLQESDQ